jgi:type IV pilus assembly protein PilB
MTLIDELIRNGNISAELASEILEKTAGDTEAFLDDLLIDGGVEAADITAVRSRIFNIPIYTVDFKNISFDILKKIPQESVERYRFIPLSITDGVLEVGIVDPDYTSARDAISFIANRLGMPYRLGLITKTDFNDLIQEYKSLSGQVTKVVGDFETAKKEADAEDSKRKSRGGAEEETQDLNRIVDSINHSADGSLVEDAPIIKLVAAVLKNAIDAGASDIHIEPIDGKLQIRFRTDGVLHVNLELPKEAQSAMIARIKILSNLKLDEKRKPQDGRFSSMLDDRKVDFRVSTLPCYYGEKAVIRILDSSKGIRDLDKIGLTVENLALARAALDKPYGIILISGPTGSGKTTTLYSMLGQVDKFTENVVSLEDPVEYNISGVNQSQIMPEIGYTFAAGLRSILRQDPDVILLGEIRDKETAQLAIQAALTGHLVLSTIHTNTAIGVVPRLLDMGVDPYLIAPTLICAVGQRLCQSIDPNCKKSVAIEDSTKMMIDKQFADMPEEFRNKLNLTGEVFEAEGNEANPSGLKGRIPVHEILWVDKDIERAILTTPTEPDIYKVARSKGYITLKEDALFKSKEGKIPFHEVFNL